MRRVRQIKKNKDFARYTIQINKWFLSTFPYNCISSCFPNDYICISEWARQNLFTLYRKTVKCILEMWRFRNFLLPNEACLCKTLIIFIWIDRINVCSKWIAPPTTLIQNATYIATQHNQSYGQSVPIKCNHVSCT